MLTENEILLFLYNDAWFTPSASSLKKTIIDEEGNSIDVPQSYYHKFKSNFIQSISIRVSDHGTALQTWVTHEYNPNSNLQNLSVVFSKEPAKSNVKTEPIRVKDESGNVVLKHLYFVVEQYNYKLDNLAIKDFKKIINRIKSLSNENVFTDPFKNKPSKVANRKVLEPEDMEGNKIPTTNNPVHPRQTIVANNKDFEVDAYGNMLKESDLVRIICEAIINRIYYNNI